jgi:hypothetical protein
VNTVATTPSLGIEDTTEVSRVSHRLALGI